jgi:pimeloyl-[acyl-carrier protein] methyl ester esterase
MRNTPLQAPTLLFVHGWAFDADFWAPLAAALLDLPQATFDAGYFGPARTPCPDGPVIAIGHSLGVLRLLRERPPNGIGLVSINGFARFAAAPDFAPGVPPRMLDRMLARLAAQPDAVLRDFRQRCGATGAFGLPNIDVLARDLRALRDDDQRAALAALPVPCLALAGDADPIVPAPMTQATFGDGVVWREGGGHLLPVTDTDWCAAQIRAFLARLAPAA